MLKVKINKIIVSGLGGKAYLRITSMLTTVWILRMGDAVQEKFPHENNNFH